ncbi:MAG TPA: ABC transporter permease subunit [Actinophytocola sp.]|nr:ABC transporter permease subunit [Actinophytocola sp.]
MTATVAMPPVRTATRTTAPLLRLLRSELRFMLRRPRTMIALGLVALVPVVAGIGIAVAATSATPNDQGPSVAGIAAILASNGLVLPVFVLLLTMAMLLPMLGAMWAADSIAGESATGGLRNLLLAPVSRPRLLAVKAFGVATMTLLAVTLMAVVGVLAGLTILGGDGMLTLSGSTLPFGAALGRIALLTVLVTIQVWAVAAIALAISSCTDHPLIVLATSLGGIIMFTVLGAIDSLSWLHPALITDGWQALADVARDPMPTDAITEGLLRAACYILIGYSLALARMVTRDG